MKKVILLLLVAFSLNASEYLCDLYVSKYMSSIKMAQYAAENEDRKGVLRYTKKSLHNIEKVGSECVGVDVDETRAILKQTIKKWE